MNRHQRRAYSSKDGIMRAQDGRRMAVMRPDDPETAIKLAEEAERTQDTELMATLPDRAGCPYRFIGWLAADAGSIVKESGQYAELKAGDSFMTFENDQAPKVLYDKQEKPS